MNDIRYGIFLRPDPQTCWAVTQITRAVRQQFGITAGAAFAPHATLIGNLQTDLAPSSLVELLDTVFADLEPITVYNHGVSVGGNSIRYDINKDVAGAGPNRALASIAHSVRAAVQPLHIPHADLFAPNVSDYRFAAHLTLAGFDLDIEPRLTHEVHEFIRGLPISAPSSFATLCYTLFEFRAVWDSQWWHEMEARHVRSWEVH